MRLRKQSLLFYFCTALVAASCSTVKRLKFEKPVDTKSKRIHVQKKKVFQLDAMGLYATNDFLASRLNGFEMVNDSTAKVIITPENAPINNSAYYSFKLWSTTAKTYYLLFDYPDGGMTPFRGEKATTWEGGFRAPCLIKWPAKNDAK